MDRRHSTPSHMSPEPHNIPLPISIDERPEPTTDGLKAEKPKILHHRNVDDDTTFWQTYVAETGKFDKELLDNWNETLNSLLLFATLFSAINTAFIIEAYKSLQRDSAETTNSLLRLLVEHRNDNSQPSDENLGVAPWSPPSEAIRANSTLFASLACSLLASFGAILGKEMLAEYKNAGALSTLPEQGRTRQRKYNGLKQYRFHLLMQFLPALLQLSLALFLVGIVDFMWQISFPIAAVVMVPVTVGFVAYFLSLMVALRQPDSPFQTSISKSFRVLIPKGKGVFLFLAKSAGNLAGRVHAIKDSTAWEDVVHTCMQPISYCLQHFQPATTPLFWIRIRSIANLASDRLGLYNGWMSARRGLSALSNVFSEMVGWPSVKQKAVQRVSDPDTAEHSQISTMRDVASADCVVWLLEKAQNAEVLTKALEAVPLLPPEMLLKHFKSQRKILERYIPMYNSNLHRRPGDVEFRLDDARAKDAIIAGTALFHVLKSRQESDEQSLHTSQFGGDPDLFDWIGDLEKEKNIDFALLTVILCVQSQIGVETWDVEFLLRLLRRFLSMTNAAVLSGATVDAVPPMQGSGSPATLAPSTPPITLLLDVTIYCASQKHRQLEHYSVLEWCSREFEEILETICLILEAHPHSMTLTSHVAVVIAAIQWYRKENSVYPTYPEYGITIQDLRSSWLTVDKRSEFFNNVVLAFKLLHAEESRVTVDLYSALLRRTEYFLPKMMDVSNKSDGWDAWWSNFIQVVPGMLYLLRQIDSDHLTETNLAIIRILARLLPDDWSCRRVQYEIHTLKNPQLHFISPLHSEYGSDLRGLVAFALSSSARESPLIRNAIAEILGWMVQYPDVETQLPSLVNQENGIYQQSMGIPTLLFSVILDSTATHNLKEFCEYHLKLLLVMDAPENTFASTVQLEALVMTLPNLRRCCTTYLWDKVAVEGVQRLLNRLVDRSNGISWPSAFLDAQIVERVNLDGDESQTQILRLVDDRWRLVEEPTLPVWSGEALLMVWNGCLRHRQTDAGTSAKLFCQDAVSMVLECFDEAVRANHEISLSIMSDYLDSAVGLDLLEEELKAKVGKTQESLVYAIEFGWEALVIRTVGDNPENHGDGTRLGNDPPEMLEHLASSLKSENS